MDYSPWGCKESDTTERLPFTSSCSGGGSSLLRCAGVSLQWLPLSWGVGSRPTGSVVASHGSGAQAPELWCTGLVALWHVGSSRTRD